MGRAGAAEAKICTTGMTYGPSLAEPLVVWLRNGDGNGDAACEQTLISYPHPSAPHPRKAQLPLGVVPLDVVAEALVLRDLQLGVALDEIESGRAGVLEKSVSGDGEHDWRAAVPSEKVCT